MSTPPAAQSMVRRYVALSGRVIERATGRLASRNIVVGMIPLTSMWKGETARVKSTKPRFLFAIDSLGFMQTLPTWGQVRRVRPVALHDEGLEFETVRVMMTTTLDLPPIRIRVYAATDGLVQISYDMDCACEPWR